MRIVALCLLALTICAADPNGVDTPGFTPPALVPLSDAAITVGTPVWRAADGEVYVVNAKSGTALLILAKSPGFVTVASAVPLTERVQILPSLVITIPAPAPTATASNP